VNSWNPWFIRGGNWSNSSGDGVLSFNNNNGNGWSNESFRLGAVRDYNVKESLLLKFVLVSN